MSEYFNKFDSNIGNILFDIITDNNISVNGIIHVGAHDCQEFDLYKELGFDDILFIEANPEIVDNIKIKNPEINIINIGITNSEGFFDFYITKYDQASSLLKPKEHEISKIIKVKTTKLINYQNDKYNILALDVQGSELDVLLSSNINLFDLIIIELSERVRYEKQPLGIEIEKYLISNNFSKRYVSKHGKYGFSDVIFLKNK